MGINLASKIGLMSSAMMMQTGQFFDTAIQSGLSTRDAFGYALIQGGVSAGLELISPNSAWMGNFKLNAGKLLSEANKTFVVKYMKNLTKEI